MGGQGVGKGAAHLTRSQAHCPLALMPPPPLVCVGQFEAGLAVGGAVGG